MPQKYATWKNPIACCDYCGFQYKRKELKEIIEKTKKTNLWVCKACWVPDQPQWLVGMYPVDDPQAIRNPRPDTTYWQAGNTGLQIDVISPSNPNSQLAFGYPSDGSRVTQWGWFPVGLNNALGLPGIKNALEADGAVGTVTVTIG